MQPEILARTSKGWVWLDERVPVEEAFESPGEAVEAGVRAIEEQIKADALDVEEATELVADARFELGANEHHMGPRDSAAIEALLDLEDRLRDPAG